MIDTPPDRTPTSAPDDGERTSDARSMQTARSIVDNARRHQLSLIGAGVAFFATLSIAPAMIAMVSIYGLVANPAELSDQMNSLGTTMPTEARQLITDQLDQVVRSSTASLGVALVVGLVIAVWSASSAIKQLLVALSVVYNVPETRQFTRLRGLATLLTLGAIAFVVATLLALTVVPRWIGESLGDGPRTAFAIVRWPLLALAMLGALAVVYRWGPDRPQPRWQMWTWGAAAATVSWLAASGLFSLYATHFGSYNKTYGALAAGVILMLWLYLSVLCVLMGGEINAELERRG